MKQAGWRSISLTRLAVICGITILRYQFIASPFCLTLLGIPNCGLWSYVMPLLVRISCSFLLLKLAFRDKGLFLMSTKVLTSYLDNLSRNLSIPRPSYPIA